MYNPYSLEGKTILVTGASSGIGRATAIECSKMGAKVVITSRNEERLKKTLDSLEGDGHQMICFDLSESDKLDEFVTQLPSLQGLVSNAGTNKMAPVNFIKEDDLNDVLKVNTLSPILLLRLLLKKKKLEKSSSVVFTSSLSGIGTVGTGNGSYAASKGALSMFMKVAALELAAKQIRVNAVCPGMVKTQMIQDGEVTEQLEKGLSDYPLGRYGEPNDIAYAIIYLLSSASSWVTGTNMVIDGGLTIR